MSEKKEYNAKFAKTAHKEFDYYYITRKNVEMVGDVEIYLSGIKDGRKADYVCYLLNKAHDERGKVL